MPIPTDPERPVLTPEEARALRERLIKAGIIVPDRAGKYAPLAPPGQGRP